jgi:hypothetical protein
MDGSGRRFHWRSADIQWGGSKGWAASESIVKILGKPWTKSCRSKDVCRAEPLRSLSVAEIEAAMARE